MSSPVIDKYCVRIIILDDYGQQINQGSGTIIKKSDEYFILTARHCLKSMAGKNAPLAQVTQIRVERQQKFNSPFEEIEVHKLVADNEEQDWAILKVDKSVSNSPVMDTKLGENLRKGDRVFFRGYQGINNKEPRSFDASINETADDEFKITLQDSTFNQGGNLGADIAKGLSGSGVFLLRNDKIYLIGHLKSVVGEMGLNDDIKCGGISSWKKEVPATAYDLESKENLPWSEDTRNFNDIFIRRIFDALREFNKHIAVVGKTVDEKPELWDNQQFKGRVQKAVADNYFSVHGVHITKLISIGKSDKYNRQNQKEYLERINITAKRTAQLLSFILISKLWDGGYHGKVNPDPAKEGIVESFFDDVVEPALADYFNILSFLLDLYATNSIIESPFEELQELHMKCQQGAQFEQAFRLLESIHSKTDNNSFTITDCFDAEVQLAVILENVAFLSRYKMASIKSTRYQQVRNKKGNYHHYYLEVMHSDKKVSKADEKIDYVSTAPNTDAVIFYADNYTEGLNLCPFIIDFTTLEADEGCQVYFYTSRSLLNQDKLTYSTTPLEGDDTTIELEFKNLPADPPGVINVLMNAIDRIQLRKDTMHRLFMEARTSILDLWKK